MVVAAEHGLRSDLRGFVGSELMCPGDSPTGIPAGAGALEFGISSGLLARGITPIFPAFRPYLGGHVRVQIRDAGIRSPRPAKISAFGSGVGGDFAVIEYVTE